MPVAVWLNGVGSRVPFSKHAPTTRPAAFGVFGNRFRTARRTASGCGEARSSRPERTSYRELARLAGRCAREPRVAGHRKGPARGDLGREAAVEWDRIVFWVRPARRSTGAARHWRLAGFHPKGHRGGDPQLLLGSQEQLRAVMATRGRSLSENFATALPREPLLQPAAALTRR